MFDAVTIHLYPSSLKTLKPEDLKKSKVGEIMFYRAKFTIEIIYPEGEEKELIQKLKKVKEFLEKLKEDDEEIYYDFEGIEIELSPFGGSGEDD